MSKFSVVIIGKNNKDTIQKVIEKAKGVDEIVFVDTGSSDNTMALAKEAGARVEQTRAILCLKGKEYEKYCKEFEEKFGWKPAIVEGQEYFNIGEARQKAAQFAKNEWVFELDTDEEVQWKLPELEKELDECDRVYYNYIFSHDDRGNPLLQYSHSKFFKKSKFDYVGTTHEALIAREAVKDLYTGNMQLKQFLFDKDINWQADPKRKSLDLPRLEWDVFHNPLNSRFLFYVARELKSNGKIRESIWAFKEYLRVSIFVPERIDAKCYLGEMYDGLGVPEHAEEWFLKAVREDITRREPFAYLCQFYTATKQWQKAICYAKFALEIPYPQAYFFNRMDLYEEYFHMILYVSYWNLNRKIEATFHYEKCFIQKPWFQKYNDDRKWFYP